MMVWPVSSSEWTWKEGSSSASRWMATPSFSWSPLDLGSMATWMTGAGKSMDSRITGLLVVAQRLTGGGLLQTHDGDDVAGAHRLDLLTLVRVHPVDLADALLLALDRVQHRGAGLQAARVDPDEGELAQVRVAHDLERERGQRLVVGRLALDDLPPGP